MKNLCLLLLALVLVACDDPNPNPEEMDPIYQDLGKKMGEKSAELEAERKNLADAEKEMLKAAPQTGQIKFATKHYYDIKSKVEILAQAKRYYKFRQETRKNDDHVTYLAAFHAKKPWPDPQEFIEYQSIEAEREKSRAWSVKRRIEEELSPPTPVAAPKED